MANVKFYRLGRNNGVSNASYLEYQVEDGRIVFALVKGDTPSDPLEHYIWSNGIEYHIADASSLKEIENKLTILLDGAPVDTSIGKMIQDALDGYELTAENFVKLVDSSNSNVQVRVVDSSLVLTAPGSHVSIDVSTCDPEVYYLGLNPAHGDYYVKEEIITEKVGAEPRRTAYIYNADLAVWQVLDGNVDATNVFFKDGIDRTAAIGVLPATTGGEIETEGKAMNLKELLEYYLVEEMYPTVSATTGTASVETYSITLTKPNTLSNYMDHTDALVEVGTQYVFNGLSITEDATHNGKGTYTSTKSTITGMNFGAATTAGGTVDPDKTDAEAGPITTTASYDDNFDEATATITLTNNKGFTGISTATNSVIVNGNALTLTAATGSVVEGENKLTLSWTSNVSVTRDITDDQTIPAMEYYYASNKGNTSTNKKAQTSTVSWVDNNPTVTVSGKTTTFSVNAVYPYYSNGVEQTVAETVGSFTTQSITIEEGGVSKTVNAEKLALYNYKSAVANTTYVGFGLAGVEAGEQPKIFYIPNSANVASLTGASYNSNKPAGQASSFDAGCGTWSQDGTVSINGVTYTRWKNTGKFGAQNIQIKFA